MYFRLTNCIEMPGSDECVYIISVGRNNALRLKFIVRYIMLKRQFVLYNDKVLLALPLEVWPVKLVYAPSNSPFQGGSSVVLLCTVCSYYFKFGWVAEWERASHSVDHMFSLYFDKLLFQLFLDLVLRGGFGF